MEDITKLFCLVDDFCRDIEKNFAGKLLPNGKKPTRTTEIEHSEIMTIILLYQQSPCKNFKTFYLHYLTLLYKSEFPKLPSYTRFVALKPRGLCCVARKEREGKKTKIMVLTDFSQYKYYFSEGNKYYATKNESQ